MASNPHALMAGGGTGGHVFPGVAVARELETLGWRVSWTGRDGEMEERLATGAGLDFHPLPARAVVGRGPADKVAALWTLGRSALVARRLLTRLGIEIVLGTGGYVSVPAVLGARLAGRRCCWSPTAARALRTDPCRAGRAGRRSPTRRLAGTSGVPPI